VPPGVGGPEGAVDRRVVHSRAPLGRSHCGLGQRGAPQTGAVDSLEARGSLQTVLVGDRGAVRRSVVIVTSGVTSTGPGCNGPSGLSRTPKGCDQDLCGSSRPQRRPRWLCQRRTAGYTGAVHGVSRHGHVRAALPYHGRTASIRSSCSGTFRRTDKASTSVAAWAVGTRHDVWPPLFAPSGRSLPAASSNEPSADSKAARRRSPLGA
jgi:hypothetical protein